MVRESPLYAAPRRQTQLAPISAWRRIGPLHAAALAPPLRCAGGSGHCRCHRARLLRPLRLLACAAPGERVIEVGGASAQAAAAGGCRLRLRFWLGLFARRRLILVSLGGGRARRVVLVASVRPQPAQSPPPVARAPLWDRYGVSILHRRLLIALDQFRRNALRHAWHAFRKDRLAIARQLLLGIEQSPEDQVGRVEIDYARTAGERQASALTRQE